MSVGLVRTRPREEEREGQKSVYSTPSCQPAVDGLGRREIFRDVTQRRSVMGGAC